MICERCGLEISKEKLQCENCSSQLSDYDNQLKSTSILRESQSENKKDDSRFFMRLFFVLGLSHFFLIFLYDFFEIQLSFFGVSLFPIDKVSNKVSYYTYLQPFIALFCAMILYLHKKITKSALDVLIIFMTLILVISLFFTPPSVFLMFAILLQSLNKAKNQ